MQNNKPEACMSETSREVKSLQGKNSDSHMHFNTGVLRHLPWHFIESQ